MRGIVNVAMILISVAVGYSLCYWQQGVSQLQQDATAYKSCLEYIAEESDSRVFADIAAKKVLRDRSFSWE